MTERAEPSARIVAEGTGWLVTEVTCDAGPADRPYQEKHGGITIAAVMAGAFTYRTNRGRAVMTAGSLLLGNAGTCFECGHDHGRGDRCIAFQIAPAVFEDIAAGLRNARYAHFRQVRIPPLQGLIPVFARIRDLRDRPDSLLAEELMLSIAGEAIMRDADAHDPAPAARDERRIGRVLRHIQEHAASPLTIAGLARLAGMEPRRFTTVFRIVTGVTPYAYVLNLRLMEAANRLRRSDESVLRIALACGFNDLSEFTRRFHARFGTPPGRYRRRDRHR